VTRSRPVADGIVNYFSPSSITTGDPTQVGGCKRRYWFKYVQGRKEPQNAAQELGGMLHKQLENYLRTGTKAFDQRILAGRHYIPDPVPKMLIEHPMEADGLLVAGVPMIGYIDLVRQDRRYKDEEGDTREDPEGTVEILDWKTTSRLSNAKRGSELIGTVQMGSYGKWAVDKFNTDNVRLSHVYFSTKGRPESKKATKCHTRGEIEDRWEQIEDSARSLIQIAKAKRQQDVEPNLKACPVWGGCPHRSECTAGNSASLEAIFGKGGAASLLKRGNTEMSLLSKVKGLNQGAQADKSADKDAEKAKLAAEQAAAKPTASPEFVEACNVIDASGQGFPTLLGKAAVQRALMMGHNLSGSGLAGAGVLGGLSLSDPGQVLQLAGELKDAASEAPPALLPPDAPESVPELAAEPLETVVELKIDATASDAAEPAKRGRGRPKKSETPVAHETHRTAPIAHRNLIYFQCIPSFDGWKRLEGYVDDKCAQLCAEFGAADVRCAPDNGPLSFGKWKGALAALIREQPPEEGNYVLLSRSEVDEVAAEALSGFLSVVRGVR
jgi:hypothetical protein